MTDQAYARRVKSAVSDSIDNIVIEKDQFIVNPDKDFRRDRKLPLRNTIQVLLQMEGASLQNELLKSFGFSSNTPTKSAFSQQRGKLLPKAMEQLFFSFTSKLNELDTPRTTKEGYVLLACDGSDINIPYNPSDTETYHQNGNKRGYNQLHLNALNSILDGIYIDAILEPECKSHERSAFIQMVDRYNGRVPAIFIADRGYEGYNVFAHLINSKQKFIVRLKDDGSNGIISSYDFSPLRNKSGEFDCKISTILTYRQTKKIKSDRDTYTIISRDCLEYFKENEQYPLNLRIVCIKIADGVYEYLATNLDCHQFPPSRLKELYHLRWGIETSFRDLKYTIDILHFHGRKRAYVEQEIWAHLTMYNYCEAITRHVILSKKKSAKYDVKANFAVAACICKAFLRKCCDDKINACDLISRFLIPIRPGRTATRNIKSQSAKSFLYRAA